MKRIAAVAALIVTMLAVPAAAMASTGGSGSGSDRPGQGQFACPAPYLHHHYRHHHNRHSRHHRHHRHHRRALNNCPFPPPPQFPGSCQGQTFTFTWASGSNSFFEESGPILYAGEQFAYDGNIFTIGTANPAAGSYTLATVNYGPSIFYGIGYLCSG